jgi:hypothetical protein
MAARILLQNYFPVFLCFSFKRPRFLNIGFVLLADVEKLADTRMVVLQNLARQFCKLFYCFGINMMEGLGYLTWNGD